MGLRIAVTIGSIVVLAASPGPMNGHSDTQADAAADSVGAVSHRSGIDIVGRDPIQFRAADEAQAKAWDTALNVALEHRDDMGFPWIEPGSNVLELPAASDDGREAAERARSSLAVAGLTPKVTIARAPIATLDAIGDDVTRLQSEGIAHAELIWMTEPDHKNNRVIITISEMNDDLLASLAARYDPTLIAVRVRKGGPLAATGRDSDAPAFWGGAYFTTSTGKACTTGFAWSVTQSAMLTAAHCISTGGKISYPSYSNVGTVASGSEENWSDSDGTRYYTGQSVYRGDIALIRYPSKASGANIYCGAVHSSTRCAVKSMSSRWSQFGDTACTNGVVSAEWCGMVTATGGNAWYIVNGINVWARHVNQAEAAGNHCPTHGDSGSPVFRKVTGGVAAVGILSGSAPLAVECAIYFTDIQDAWYGLPGNLKIQ